MDESLKTHFTAVYQVLVDRAGANPEELEAFLLYAEEWWGKKLYQTYEWSFRGKLGFGGKIYLDRARYRVGYYWEDKTEETTEIAKDVNVRLKVLYDQMAQRINARPEA